MWSVRRLLAVIATLAPLVSAMPDGVPEQACVSMSPTGPGHENAAPQTSPLPYDVDVAVLSEYVQVNISQRPEGPTFLGFMVQARAADSDTPLGTFRPDGNQMKTVTCAGEGDTASHTNREPKSKVSLTWTPPPGHFGEIFIFVTIVEIPSTFWAHQKVGSVLIVDE